MALEDILGKLSTIKDGKQKVSDKYASQTLYEATVGLEELRKTNLDSKEGLAAYKTITGEDPVKYTYRTLDSRKNMRLQGGQKDLGAYIDNHFGKIVDELDEQTKINLAYSFCPIKDISGDKAKTYNPVRKTISDAKERIKKIKETPDAYLIEAIKKETPLMATYISRFREEFFEVEQMEAQQTAVLAIQKYKATSFINDTRKYLSGQPGEFREKESALKEAIKTKIEMAEKNAGRELNAVERTELISDKYSELQKLNEQYADRELGNKLTQETVSYAIASIQKKAEEKAKAAKATTSKKAA